MDTKLLEEINHNFYVWLKKLDHEEMAMALGCVKSRMDRYSRMTEDELGNNLKLWEVYNLAKYLDEELGLEYNTAEKTKVLEETKYYQD